MDKENIIQKTEEFVKDSLRNAEGGHDWWHVYRVWETAKNIAKTEDANLFIVELGALLHDIADAKFHNGDEGIGSRKTKEFLSSLNVEEEIITRVENIVANVSFRSDGVFKSPELSIVQDADRLDALGAIGVARTFNYGGYKERELYNPNIKPKLNMTKEEYKKNKSTSVNHFYEKLFLLKDGMNTEKGKKLAEDRHKFMEQYLDQFYKEWEGKE